MSEPIEIERKYIIELPDVGAMQGCEGYTKSEILQIYLKSERGVTHRIRRRAFESEIQYTETKKIRLDALSAIENEKAITKEEFELLQSNKAADTVPISKVRHTFVFLGQVFEVDVYPNWKKSCILETELSERNTEVTFPPFINIIKEVTGIKGYSNAQMSRSFPLETV